MYIYNKIKFNYIRIIKIKRYIHICIYNYYSIKQLIGLDFKIEKR